MLTQMKLFFKWNIVFLSLLSLGFLIGLSFGLPQKYITDARLFFLEERCNKKPTAVERENCLLPYFQLYTRQYSVQAAIAQAQTMQNTKQIDECHTVAHTIGKENLVMHSYDAGSAFATCAIGCVEGCFHGVMEEYVRLLTAKGQSLTDVSSICKDVGDTPTLFRQCIHGVGHGIVKHQTTDITAAIPICLAFDTPYTRQVCIGGALMEYVNHTLFFTQGNTAEKVTSLCMSLAEPFLSQCYISIGEGLMFYTGHDIGKSVALCSNVSTDWGESRCKKGAYEEGVPRD